MFVIHYLLKPTRPPVQDVGNAFVDAGVKHVVAVKKDKTVPNKVAIIFTKEFYQAVFKGKTVAVAFDIGMKMVEIMFKKEQVDGWVSGWWWIII